MYTERHEAEQGLICTLREALKRARREDTKEAIRERIAKAQLGIGEEYKRYYTPVESPFSWRRQIEAAFASPGVRFHFWWISLANRYLPFLKIVR